jgi:ubiquinone/menaquinone biosynthesis C-methylase UbiE
MSDKKDNYEWTSVDNTGKSEKFVNYLDITSSLEFFKVVKRESYSMLEVRKGSRVLDVGCGTGDDVLALAQIVGETGWAVGVDNSEKLIAEARKRAEDAKLPVEFKVGDAHKLEFSDYLFW